MYMYMYNLCVYIYIYICIYIYAYVCPRGRVQAHEARRGHPRRPDLRASAALAARALAGHEQQTQSQINI